MGLKDLFFGGGGAEREKKQRDRLIQKLNHRNSLHDDRTAAIEALTRDGSHDAIFGLLRRFDWTTDKQADDRTEKDYVCQVLEDELKDGAPEAIRRFILESENVAFPIQVYFHVRPEDEVVGAVLEALAQEVRRDSFKPDKKVRLLDSLRGHPDPRIAAEVGPLLEDFDEPVRYGAVEVLLEQEGEGIRERLLEAMLRPEEESQRIRSRILRGFAERGWTVGERRDAVRGVLDRGMDIDAEGRVIGA